MVESIEVINFSNDSKPLLLVLRDPENVSTSQGFAVTDVTGLGPGQATLNSSELVTIDGAEFINARLPKRTIKLTLRFIPISYEKNGNPVDETVADIRMKSYRYFPIKEKVKLIFTKIEYRRDKGTYEYIEEKTAYYIEGYVQKNEPNIWSKEEGSSIEIVCMDPYFKSVETQKKSFSDILAKFHYKWITPDQDLDPISATNNPFIFSERKVRDFVVMNNESYVETGGIFTIKAIGTVVNPSIFNQTTNQIMTFNMTMHKGDVIVVDTRKGYKSATLKEGFGVSVINRIDILTCDWITFRPGDNVIGFTCEYLAQRDHLDVSVEIRPLYAGI